MPATIDVISAGVRLSLAGGNSKAGPETNGDLNHLDSALAAGNKLAEITKHLVEYEPADNLQSNSQNVLKSKYAVLDIKQPTASGIKPSNGMLTNGTKDGACSTALNGVSKFGSNGSFSNGSQCNGVNGSHSNVGNGNQVNGTNKNVGSTSPNLLNGLKRPGVNGLLKVAPNIKGHENGSPKPSAVSDSTLPEPKLVLYQPEKVTLGWKNQFRAGAGMVNLGNTCYLNATLQALFHIPAFVEWLSNDTEHLKKCELINGMGCGDCITCSMAKTFRASQNNPIVKPHLITNKLRMICRHMSVGSQEDAHEFMRHLLENMEKAYLNRFKTQKLDVYSKETTPINQIFGGYIRTEVKCLKCQYASTTFQHFQDLILDIRKASKVEDAMDQYFSREKLDDTYKCEKCKCGVPATKKFSIERPPKVLCIQLKRFNAVGVKLPKPVEHKLQMDIKRHVHPQSSFAKYSSLPYRLISMVTHVGPTSACGHYTAIAQSSSKTFHHFDDTHVHPVAMQAVLNYCAYILIYEMEPQALRTVQSGQKAVPTAAISSITALGHNTQNGLNGNMKNSSHSQGGLPAAKDRDRVAFGLTLPKPASAQPRLVIHSKKPDANNVSPAPKALNSQNGSMVKEARASSFIGPVQVVANKKLPGSSGILKLSDSGNDSSVVLHRTDSSSNDLSLANKSCEPDKRQSGSLVPYDCDDDSSSRDSSLSPPLNDEHEVLTVKATTSSWQVTSSSELRSPSIHSESSNHSVASTGSNWNVTEKQPEKHPTSLRGVTIPKVKEIKIKENTSQTTYSSDPELDSQTLKPASKCHQRAKSVEREFNLTKNALTQKNILSMKKARVRRSSLSSDSDSSSSKLLKKKLKMQDQSGVETNLQHADGNSRLETSAVRNGNGRPSVFNNKSAETQNNTAQSSSSTWNGEGNSKTVNDLMKMSHQGFGNNRVSSWNGDQSQVERNLDDERQASRKRSRDEYEAELDRGRVKKLKRDYNRWRPYPPSFPHRPGSSGYNHNRKYDAPYHHSNNFKNHSNNSNYGYKNWNRARYSKY